MNAITPKYPHALKVFFATEMWERYGFYVVQSLLALYLSLHFKWSDKHVYHLVGAFTALTYLSPVVGGWIADHLLGQKRSILAGAVFLFISYIFLALTSSRLGLTASLAAIAVGTGLLKANISSLLGNIYPDDAPNRESGFTIFYMGITTGIILGTTLPSYINAYFGWSASFASAAIGMVISFLVFAFGIKVYKIEDYHARPLLAKNVIKASVIILGLWIVGVLVLRFAALADIAFGFIVALCLVYFIVTIRNESPKQARQTMVIALLCLISVMFWAFYFQMFLSLTLFLKRVVEHSFMGINFPPPYYVGVQSLGMLFFGYFLSRKTPQLNSIQSAIRTGNKFLLAMIFMCFAFAIFTLVSRMSSGNNLLSPLYFIPAYLLISIAELLLSPVGLSAITVLASRRKVSTMMGIFFVSLGLGSHLSSKIAILTAVRSTNQSIGELKMHYAQSFGYLFLILLAATCCCALLNLYMRHLLLRKPKA